jgi:hypothetical protein
MGFTKLKYREPTDIQEIIKQPLWNNSVGINNLSDLIVNNGEIATLDFLEHKYRFKCKQMNYNSIMHSIPNAWKKEVKERPNLTGITTIKEYCLVINDKLCNIDDFLF